MITTNLDTLRVKSEPVKEEELDTIIQALEDDLQANSRKGVGLSGIQINIPKRVAIIRYNYTVKVGGKKEQRTTKYNLYNAEIIEKSQPFIYKGEGCLSIPEKTGDTQRFNNVKVKNGDGEIYSLSGFLAVVAQHELDHWDGILFVDRLIDKGEKEHV